MYYKTTLSYSVRRLLTVCHRSLVLLASVLALIPGQARLRADEPPVLPVEYDAYRLWDHWPYQRIGERAYLRSTYDRKGGNKTADAGSFLYQLADDNNVTLDVVGPGVLYFTRFNRWHGSPWRFVVDGQETQVQESTTPDPDTPIRNSLFQPDASFPSPLAATWSTTKGSDVSWIPISFLKAFRLGYARTHYGTGYTIYHLFTPDAKLSHPLTAWNPAQTPPQDVINLFQNAGNDPVPQPGTPEGKRIGLQKLSGNLPQLAAHTTVTLPGLTAAPAMLRSLEFSIPFTSAEAFETTWLRITWDNRKFPSINAPVPLFFGAGTLYNRANREFLVQSFPLTIRFDFSQNRIYFACYFPMPYFHEARIQLVTGAQAVHDLVWSMRVAPYKDPANQVAYFHASYADFPRPVLGKDLVFLDTRSVEGGGDWSGHLVGTSWIFSHAAELTTLEGDPRFFFDDSLTPQVQGTGTEEWGGGGNYWGGNTTTLPFAGHPVGAPSLAEARNDRDKIESAYRFLLADLMPFGKNARIGLEHGGEDQSNEHYESVTYWYGVPAPSLVLTDELKIGNTQSEAAHHYLSATASAPYSLTSRYEWGVDTLNGVQIYPARTDTGRTMTGASEFTLTLDLGNLGVLLQRKLDYLYPNQRANVYVARVPKNGQTPDWKLAGVWYLAGSSISVYSNPADELGATEHLVRVSDRRFRDDEFLLPRKLTAGLSAVRVRIVFQPVNLPLFPGDTSWPAPAWSEMRYRAYCYRLPDFTP